MSVNSRTVALVCELSDWCTVVKFVGVKSCTVATGATIYIDLCASVSVVSCRVSTAILVLPYFRTAVRVDALYVTSAAFICLLVLVMIVPLLLLLCWLVHE